jgi:broad specificity phosphatase PhoE
MSTRGSTLTAGRYPPTRGVGLLASITVGKEVELRRHTDADEDILTSDGVSAALSIGAHLRGGYHVAVSSGAQRATQTLACLLAALGEQVPAGVVVEPDLRSLVEDSWRDAYRRAGSSALEALREVDPGLVAEESDRLGAALRRVLEALPDGGRALVVGHSPTNEAAVLGLTGEIVDPIEKGAGVLVSADQDGYRVEPLA